MTFEIDPLFNQLPHEEGENNLLHPIFCIAPYKAGSTMLFSYFADILRLFKISLIDYPTFYFHSLNKLNEFYDNINTAHLYEKNFVYLGHRQIPYSLLNNNWPSRLIMFAMIRNPKDALVSMYYSFLGSHIPPACIADPVLYEKEKIKLKNLIDINNYVTSCSSSYFENLKNILHICKQNSNNVILKYEDVIFNKKNLVEIILNFIQSYTDKNLPIASFEVALNEIILRHDIIPNEENQALHIRKAIPGDWKSKLSKHSALFLDELFEPLLFEHYDFSR